MNYVKSYYDLLFPDGTKEFVETLNSMPMKGDYYVIEDKRWKVIGRTLEKKKQGNYLRWVIELSEV